MTIDADVIELLISSGKQVNAVRLIHAFELTRSFPPVPLLKTYLKDLRRNSQGKGASSEGVAGVQVLFRYSIETPSDGLGFICFWTT